MDICRDGLIALHQIPGAGWHTIDRLIQNGWSLREELSLGVIERLRGKRIPQNTIKNIREKWSPRLGLKVKKELIQRNIGVITRLDANYPALLKEIAQPPWVLYYKGDSSLLEFPSLAMVGTRKPTHYGVASTRILSEKLSQMGWVIVSGMATGIDGEAHRSVLNFRGRTIAVLGCGVDVVYPKHHRSLYGDLVERGLVLSEMPPGTRPHPGLFPQRNRIISGLSYGTVVVEAAEKSGSLITAEFSMEQGREVFAVPGPITSEQSGGSIRLIQQGAKCVKDVTDIVEDFAYLFAKPKIMPVASISSVSAQQVELCQQEEELLLHIETNPIQITNLMERVAGTLSVGEIHRFLLSLETKGQIRQLPGSSYVLT